MDDRIEELEIKIERCRRLKNWMTDDEVREALEQLAREYEAELPSRGEGFMIRPGAGHG